MKFSVIVIALTYWVGFFILSPLVLIFLNRYFLLPSYSPFFLKGIGAAMILGGIVFSFYCYILFARIGKGTPVPIEPPKHLVITRLYRYTRNPIYLAQYAIVLGEFLFFGPLLLLLYFFFFIVIMHFNIVYIEEKELKKRFGKEYKNYVRNVPRYLFF